jgi:exosome complex component RRP41
VNIVWLHSVPVNEKRRRKETGSINFFHLYLLYSRSTEISYVIRQTFESVIMTNLFPRSEISIYVQVLQADGGTRCAAINAATLALINAGIPMKDFVVACAAGCIDGTTPILDLNYLEDSAGGPDLPVALLPSSEAITMVQMDSKVPIEMFEKVVKLAVEGCKAIHQILLQEVEKYTLGRSF